MRARWVAIAAAMLAAHAAFAAAPSDRDEAAFQRLLIQAVASAAAGALGLARQRCHQARALAGSFDRNEYWLGEIAACYGHVAFIRNRMPAACAAYRRAATHLAKAAPNYRTDADSTLADMQRRRQMIGC